MRNLTLAPAAWDDLCLAVPGYRFFGWDPDNVSYWVALLFTLGSVAWVINGFYLFLPTGNAAVDLYASGYSGALVQTLLLIDNSPPDFMFAVCCSINHVPLHGERAFLVLGVHALQACLPSSILYEQPPGAQCAALCAPQLWLEAHCSQLAHTWASWRRSTPIAWPTLDTMCAALTRNFAALCSADNSAESRAMSCIF